MTISEKLSQSQEKKIPAKLGFSMPAEWAQHEATWLAWPQNVETWPGPHLKIVEEAFLQMMEGLLPQEKVNLLVQNQAEGEQVKKRLQGMGIKVKNLIPHVFPTVDSWIRDYGPTFLLNQKGEKAWVKWIFNAWGAKYESLMKDTEVFEKGASMIPHPCFKPGIVMEGGSIEVNGEGVCMITEQCQLNPNRNPKLNKKQIEEYLRNYLGVSQILWLGEGIVGDDTDGHIDDIARFVDKQTILAAFEEDERDANYGFLKENWEKLQHSTDTRGKKWNLIKLPMPGKLEDAGVRLPASYANFYIGNASILLPVFKHKNDDRAVKILREIFPKREIIPIDCRSLVYGLGAIHCVSQQEPASN